MIFILKYSFTNDKIIRKTEQSKKLIKLNFRLKPCLLELLKARKKRKQETIIERVSNPMPRERPSLSSSFGPSKLAKPAQKRIANGKSKNGYNSFLGYLFKRK